MKNYKEMADNVFRRRNAYVVRQKRNRLMAGSALTVAAACLVGVIALKWHKPAPTTGALSANTLPNQTVQHTQPPTAPTDPTEQPPAETGGHLTVLAYTTNAIEAQLQENIVLPLVYYIGVTDIRDLDSEDAVRALMNRQSAEMDAYLQGLASGQSETLGLSSQNTLRRDNYIISTLRYGSFQLCFDNIANVETVNVNASSGYGEVTVYQEFTASDPSSYLRGTDITVDAEEFFTDELDDLLLLDWMYSVSLLEELEDDPTVPLTNYSDTIVITVTYRDGTEQSCNIDIIINEDGSISALLYGDQFSLKAV